MNADEELNREKYERNILNSLYEGGMTFSQASEKLGVSKEKVKEMFESFDWIPSSDCMEEICEIKREVLVCIEEEIQSIIHQSFSNPLQYEYIFVVADNVIVNQVVDFGIQTINKPFIQESISITDIQCNDQFRVSNEIIGWYQSWN